MNFHRSTRTLKVLGQMPEEQVLSGTWGLWIYHLGPDFAAPQVPRQGRTLCDHTSWRALWTILYLLRRTYCTWWGGHLSLTLEYCSLLSIKILGNWLLKFGGGVKNTLKVDRKGRDLKVASTMKLKSPVGVNLWNADEFSWLWACFARGQPCNMDY